MLGKIFKNILIFVIGMIFGIVALFGVGYIAIKKVKIGQITDKVLPEDQQYVGEELKKLSILQGFELLSKFDSTKLSEYNKLVPVLGTTIEKVINENLKDYVIVDYDKLYDSTISTISDNLKNSLSVIISLNGLKDTLGFTLPDLPLFDSVEKYIKISDDSYVIKNKFYLTEENKQKIYYMSSSEPITYDLAYGESGEIIEEATSKDLYFKSTGISSIPVTDAISSLTDILNVSSLTIGDLETNFGLKLLQDESGKDTVLAKIFNDKDVLNSLGSNITERIKSLSIKDLGIETTGMLNTLITKDDGTYLTIDELTNSDTLNSQIDKMKLSDFGIEFDSESEIVKVIGYADPTVSQLKEANFTDNINDLTLEDLNISLTGLALTILPLNTKISDLKSEDFLNNKIDDLTISDIGISISGLASEILTPTTKISDLKSDGFINNKINGITVERLGLNITEGGIMSKIIPAGTTVEGLSGIDFEEKINSLSMEDLNLDFASNPIMSKIILRTDTVSGLAKKDFTKRINNLDVADVFGEDAKGILGELIYKHNTDGSTTSEKTKISEIDGEIKYAKLSSLIGNTSTNKILKKLLENDATINNLEDKLSELKVNDIFEIKVFVTTPLDVQKAYFVKTIENGKEVYTETTNTSGVVYQISETASIWLFMLYEKDATSTTLKYKQKEDISLLGMDTEVNSMSNAFSNATMYELFNMGIIKQKPKNTTIGNYTLDDLIKEISKIN